MTSKIKVPELLSPAGTRKHLDYAFAYGADAVYAGQPRYSLRVRNNEFSKLSVLGEGIARAHALGRKFFLASNLAPHNNKVKTYLRDLEPVLEYGPDALIMSDPGLIMLVRERWPDQVIHLSVQANVVNFASVRFWQKMGVQRVILSRELSLNEIREIREECQDMELETFVHGALCIAYSGRCLLSGYMSHRDSNQGTCTNSCRWRYKAVEATETEAGDIVPFGEMGEPPQDDPVAARLADGLVHVPADENVTGIYDELPLMLLEEENRPGEYMPAYEDEHGTYIMNSRDLRAIQHVGALAELGIDSLKIEGRTKSYYYVARTAQTYRRAIDDAVAGRPFDIQLMDVLEGMSNRGFTEGFYRRHLPEEYQNYEQGASTSDLQQYVGDVLERRDNKILVDVRNRFQIGDTLELMTPAGNRRFVLDALEDSKGQSREDAPGSGYRVWMPLPQSSENASAEGEYGSDTNLTYGMLIRDLPRS